MKALLERLRRERPESEGRVNVLTECQGALTARLQTHWHPSNLHTTIYGACSPVCTESGVDIQTLSRWQSAVTAGRWRKRPTDI